MTAAASARTNEQYITDYFTWRKAAIRRAMMVANSLPDEAMRRSLLTPKVVAHQVAPLCRRRS